MASKVATRLFLASPASLRAVTAAETLHSSATTLVISEVIGNNSAATKAVTYSASRVNDSSLYNLSTPTTVVSGSISEVVYPLGYIWTAQSSDPSPAISSIPTDAPYAYLPTTISAGNSSSGSTAYSSSASITASNSSITSSESTGGSLVTSSSLPLSNATSSGAISGSASQVNASSTQVSSSQDLQPSSSANNSTPGAISSNASLSGAPSSDTLSSGASSNTLTSGASSSDTLTSGAPSSGLSSSLSSSQSLGSPSPPSVGGFGSTSPVISTGATSSPSPSTGPITSEATTETASTQASATSTPTIPFGVFVTTISNTPYTLTFVSTTAKQGTTFVESDASTTTTSSVTAGGAIWALPTLPIGFPLIPFPGPPPGAPPPSISGSGFNPLCIFGCGGGGGGSSSSTPGKLPCVIGCGGGESEPTGSGSNSNDPTSNEHSSVSSSRSSSETCTSGTTVRSCREDVQLSTSFVSGGSSSTVISSTSTSCITITTCSATATTSTSTTSTGSSKTEEIVCVPQNCGAGKCGTQALMLWEVEHQTDLISTACNAKRAAATGPVTPMVSLVARGAEFNDSKSLFERDLPQPPENGDFDSWLSGIMEGGHVRGGQGNENLVVSVL